MKKTIISAIVFLFLVACSITTSTPKSAVEDLLKKYQMKDSIVISQLDEVVDGSISYTDDQKKQYKDILMRQYSDMTYDIKDERVDGNNAVVVVEVEVYDYASVMLDGVYDNVDEYTTNLFNSMKNVNNRIKYTIEFNVRNINHEWVVDAISDVDRKKIHGLY